MAPGDISDTLPAACSAAPVTPQQHEQQQQQLAPALASGPAAIDGTAAAGSSQKPVAEYLAAYPHLTDLDRHILQLPSDAHFTPHSWADLHRLIGANHLHLLTRSPSQTRAYLDWTSAVRQQFGSITSYLLAERLHWTPLPNDADGPVFAFTDPTPFADPDDYLVLQNDWPYGLAPGIVHICVWLKTPLALKPDDGDLTDDARAQVEAFVTRTFREPLGEAAKGERVLWFKNWAKLQSVRGIDHVHVLVDDAPPEQLRRWMK